MNSVIHFDNLDKATSSAQHAVQYIPANIAYNGSEKIGPFFTQYIKKNEEKDCLEVSFQGRPLEGEVKKMPEGQHIRILPFKLQQCRYFQNNSSKTFPITR